MKLRHFTRRARAARGGHAHRATRASARSRSTRCARSSSRPATTTRATDACKRAMDNARSTGQRAGSGRPDELRRGLALGVQARRGRAHRPRGDRRATAWYGNPWSELAELYVREGALPRSAVGAASEIPEYRMQRPPHVRDADRNENRRALSSFFLVLGRPTTRCAITQKALVAPDRRGHNSRDPAQDRSVSALLDRGAHRLKAERSQEHAASAALAPAPRRACAGAGRARPGLDERAQGGARGGGRRRASRAAFRSARRAPR